MPTLVFWKVPSPHRLIFYCPLPVGTQVRDTREAPVWVTPNMGLSTRFPMRPAMAVRSAMDFIERVREESAEVEFVLVAWCWDKHPINESADFDPADKLRLAFFRGQSNEILRLGSTQVPEWLVVLEEQANQDRPTFWDRLDSSYDKFR